MVDTSLRDRLNSNKKKNWKQKWIKYGIGIVNGELSTNLFIYFNDTYPLSKFLGWSGVLYIGIPNLHIYIQQKLTA